MSPQRVHPRTCLADVRRRTGNDRYPTASTFPPETALTKFMQNLFRDYVDGPRIVRMTIGEAQHSFAHVWKGGPLATVLMHSRDCSTLPVRDTGSYGIRRAVLLTQIGRAPVGTPDHN